MQVPPSTVEEFEILAERLRITTLRRGILLSTIESQNFLAEVFGFIDYEDFKTNLQIKNVAMISTWPDGAIIYQKRD